MDCPNLKECELLRLKDDLGLILQEDYEIGKETSRQIQDRFFGIEPFILVRDSDDCGLGRLYFRDVFLCDTLENPDYFMPLGLFRLSISYSPKFKVNLPEVLIPEHSGVRIHVANSIKDLKGCIGVGVRLSKGSLLSYSQITLDRIIRIIRECDVYYLKIC